MLLQNSFYSILNNTIDKNRICAEIKIDANHHIFDGHFPDNPVTPGVVQLEIIKELISISLKKKLSLKKLNNCKFLAVLNPVNTPTISIEIDIKEQNSNSIAISGIMNSADSSFIKLSALYNITD